MVRMPSALSSLVGGGSQRVVGLFTSTSRWFSVWSEFHPGFTTAGEGNDAMFSVINPSTREVIGYVPNNTIDDCVATIEKAHEAQKSWMNTTARERNALLNKWAGLIMDNSDYLGKIITLEMGKPIKEGIGEIAYGASFVSYYAGEIMRMSGEVSPIMAPNQRIVVLKQPVGTTACVTPWNFPSAMITRKASAALAAGCSMVVKPSAETPLSAMALCYLAEQAGIPDGILPILTCDHQRSIDIGKELAMSERIAKLSFTGSTAVGKKLMAMASSTVKRTSMELGGNAPFIVFDDADIQAAVAGAIVCKFRNAGQTCVCANRFFVQDGIYDEFMALFKTAIEGLQVGDGFDEHVDVGPMITDAAALKVHAMVQDTLHHGANLVCGGSFHAKGANFYAPTLIENVGISSRLFREEIFGPIAAVHRFTTDQEVIEKANNTRAGLVAYFYSNNLKRVWSAAEQLQYGMVGVNTGIVSTEVAPFGGIKESGIGREGSSHGMDEYQELKYILMDLGTS
eukprot:m.81585 g.81585  ORF g.81585 m.81585 type:complete len:512 (-) comp8647_c0_seq1:319-1854(-)